MEQTTLKKTLKRRIKSLQKHLKKATAALEACKNHEKVFHQAKLLQAHLYLIKKGEKQVVVSDWEKNGEPVLIEMDLPPKEELKRRFKLAKKLKVGLPYQEIEVEKTQLAIENFCAILKELEMLETKEELDLFQKKYTLPIPQQKIAKEKSPPIKPYIEYISKTGIPIWVGKSAAKNDLMTFSFANGNDLWLHVSDYPGSHVVIHSKEPIDNETLQMALKLALRYSKAASHKEAFVSTTKVKHVRRFGNIKGKVQISNEKRIYVKISSLNL